MDRLASFLAWISAYLVENIGPMGPLFGLAVVGMMLIAIGLPGLFHKTVDPREKFRTSANWLDAGGPAASQFGKAALRNAARGARLERFAGLLEPKNQAEMSTARMKMLQAGYASRDAVRIFHAAKFLLGLGGLAAGMLYNNFYLSFYGAPPLKVALWVLGPGLVGYYIPSYWVERRRQARQEEITNGFPDSLDLMLVCVEAGQSLDQAINRVAKEMQVGYPALAEEFDLVALQIKAGNDRASVLKAMADRTGVNDIGSFVTVLIQSTLYGTSIAEALRIYASEMRDKRMTLAEEKASKLPTKLTLGTMLFTLPPLLMILIAPSIYDVSQIFKSIVR
ncbi:MAG: type II secretion system F family protein [Paracoccaceae bacterium]|jgi:tight adherence protein C|nr:type II secretion system F family protein [Paracoccaceae bacterium]